MKIFWLIFISRLLHILSLICIGLIIVPLFFPVFFLCSVLIIGAAFSLWYLAKKWEKLYPHIKAASFHKVQNLSQRSARISLISLGINFFLYTFLRMHINFCYIKSLDKELEPVRKDFRSLAEEKDKKIKIELGR